jgi:UDP-glucose-4-epimerase GalE
MAKLLVTGGAGYIGSHTAHTLLRRGHQVTVADDLSKGRRHNVAEGRLREVSVADESALDRLFAGERFEAVVHFAAFIAVGESVRDPLRYFSNNVAGSLALFRAMDRAGVRRLVFSSTAAVYGNPASVPIAETAALAPVNPYGESKLAVENILGWLSRCAEFRPVILRYFNACGADPELGLGEEHDPETHLIPLALRAILTGEPLTVFGDDYPTPDGSAIRDFVHVADLADAHVRAVEHLLGGGGSETFNCGTGSGFSVREVLAAAERVTGRAVPHTVGPRRAGDPAELVADSTRLQERLGWKPRYTSLDEIVATAWAFEQRRSGLRD